MQNINAIVIFDDYTEQPKGIVLISDKYSRTDIIGRRAEKLGFDDVTFEEVITFFENEFNALVVPYNELFIDIYG